MHSRLPGSLDESYPRGMEYTTHWIGCSSLQRFSCYPFAETSLQTFYTDGTFEVGLRD